MSVYNYMTLDATGANAGTSAYDINNAGQIVGSYTFVPGGLFPTQKYGFIYNPQDGTYTGLNDPFSAVFTSAQGINDVGQVVGHYLAAGLYHGFLYSGGTYTTLDAPGATQTQAYGINNVGLGQIVGLIATEA